MWSSRLSHSRYWNNDLRKVTYGARNKLVEAINCLIKSPDEVNAAKTLRANG